MTREVYTREKPLSRWNTKLNWIKSGSASRVMDVPYEIYSKRYGPDLLAIGTVNIDIALRLGNELRNMIRTRRFKGEHLINATATAVVGKNLDSQAKARRAYRGSGKAATMHTLRYRIADLPSLIADLQGRLDHLAQLPSKPSWLVATDVTVYLDEEEEKLIKKSGVHKTYA